MGVDKPEGIDFAAGIPMIARFHERAAAIPV
jgi:hypothetical protein